MNTNAVTATYSTIETDLYDAPGFDLFDADFVSPIIRNYFISLNDRWPDDRRQALRPYLLPMIGTVYDGRDPERERVLWEALEGLVGPWLRLAGLNAEADALAAVGVGDVAAMRAAWRVARDASRRVRDEARARVQERIRIELKERGAALEALAAGAAEAAVDALEALAAEDALSAGAAEATVDAEAALAAVAAEAAEAAEAAVDALEALAAEDALSAGAAEATVDAEAALAAVAAEAAEATEADWATVAAEAAGAALDAVAAGSSHWTIRTRVYDAVRAYFREHPPELPAEVTELAEQQRGAALELLARLIDPTREATS